VDFDGPHGWTHAALNLGRLDLQRNQPVPGVHAATRKVQPLVEFRTPFHLDILDLDGAARGASQFELGAVVEAAERTAHAEDKAIFYGYPEAGITGIVQATPHRPLTIPASASQYPQVIVEAQEVLREAGVSGPYALALGTECYRELSLATEEGYPIRKRIERQIIDGPLYWAPAVDGAMLLSLRGGDFLLSVGQDLSIGYAAHDKDRVELYVTESFTFRVLDGSAAVHFQRGKK
jgi:uncharacterized linocin/CFP29 family protein